MTDGRRARGLAVVADVSGGLAVGVKDFWQKAGKSFELLHGGGAAGELRVWLWSPEAGAMDLLRYDEIPHGLSINYEDWKPGWGAPLGIANTHDLTLWAFDKIPANAELIAMARDAAEPPLLVCTPEYYHAQQAAGRWSLPDRSTPALRWVALRRRRLGLGQRFRQSRTQAFGLGQDGTRRWRSPSARLLDLTLARLQRH